MILPVLMDLSEILVYLMVWRNSSWALKRTWVYFSSAGGRKPRRCCFWTLSIDDAMLFLVDGSPYLHSPDMTPCMSPLPHDSPLIEARLGADTGEGVKGRDLKHFLVRG